MNGCCSECNGNLRLDIGLQKLICDNCKTEFLDKDISLENISSKHDGYYKNKIYACETCGTEISLIDEGVPDFCVYCGNSKMHFVREAVTLKPNLIIPFQVTREEAIAKVKSEYLTGFFLPKTLLGAEPEMVRGIYIPYYVVKVDYDSSLIVMVSSGGEIPSYDFYLRTAYGTLSRMTVDALSVLRDEESERIEPFKFDKCKEFNEGYLRGFFSGVADVSFDDAVISAKTKAERVVDHALLHAGHLGKIKKARRDTAVYERPKTAMCPAWFLTYKFGKKKITFVVNGQTGELSGDIPFNKLLFYFLLIFCPVAGAVIFGLLAHFLKVLGGSVPYLISCVLLSINFMFFAITATKLSVILSYYRKRKNSSFFSVTQSKEEES